MLLKEMNYYHWGHMMAFLASGYTTISVALHKSAVLFFKHILFSLVKHSHIWFRIGKLHENIFTSLKVIFISNNIKSWKIFIICYCCCSAPLSCLTLCDFMNCSMPDSYILHCRPEFAQIHVSWVSGAI